MYVNARGDFSQFNTGEIIYARFFPHGILEPFFIGGNLLIFAFAGVGLYRYWQSLNTFVPAKSNIGFLGALIGTCVELLTHRNFKICSTNSTRYWGHLLIFYGFAGAMVTAGLALLSGILFNLEAPIPFLTPIKILGNLSGLAMLTGSSLVIIKRLRTEERVESNTYNDWVLVLFIFGVGLTGLLTEVTRLTATPFIAYNTYFVHLVLVFFLLWYAPYSKLAHMFYRTLALVYLKMNARDRNAFVVKSVREVGPGALDIGDGIMR